MPPPPIDATGALCFYVVQCPSVSVNFHACVSGTHLVSSVSYKPVYGISPNFD